LPLWPDLPLPGIARLLIPLALAIYGGLHTLLATVAATITWHSNDDVSHDLTSEGRWFRADNEPADIFNTVRRREALDH